MKVYKHAVATYFRNNNHAITVDVAGAGGTGSLLLAQLVRLHRALIDRGQGGLHVRVFDPGSVTEPNLVRQLFSPSDLHQNKAVTLVNRINRTFGTAWDAFPVALEPAWNKAFIRSAQLMRSSLSERANLTITCVDTIKARVDISRLLNNGKINHSYGNPLFSSTPNSAFEAAFYWLDLGNEKSFGQAILATVGSHLQPHKQRDASFLGNNPDVYELTAKEQWAKCLPSVIERYGTEGIDEDALKPSCSVAEALNRQDLTINQMTATIGMTLLWNLFTRPVLTRCGVFFNLEPFGATDVLITKPATV